MLAELGVEDVVTRIGYQEGVAPVYLLKEKGYYMNALDDLRRLGVLTGHEKEAEKAIQRFLKKLEDYKNKSSKNAKVLILLGSDTNFQVYTEKSRTGSLLAEVANYPTLLSPGAKEQYEIAISIEKVLEINPDVLIMESLGEEKLSKQLKEAFGIEADIIDDIHTGVPLCIRYDLAPENNGKLLPISLNL